MWLCCLLFVATCFLHLSVSTTLAVAFACVLLSKLGEENWESTFKIPGVYTWTINFPQWVIDPKLWGDRVTTHFSEQSEGPGRTIVGT